MQKSCTDKSSKSRISTLSKIYLEDKDYEKVRKYNLTKEDFSYILKL